VVEATAGLRFCFKLHSGGAPLTSLVRHSMSTVHTELWSAWQSSADVRQIAEAWMTKPDKQWTEDAESLYGLFHSAPSQALSVIFAVMQMTDDKKILGGLAAGPLEDFLGVQGEAYIDTIHKLALEQRRLREVLEGVWQGSMSATVWRRIETLKQRAFS
jgi:hypothetical protein